MSLDARMMVAVLREYRRRMKANAQGEEVHVSDARVGEEDDSGQRLSRLNAKRQNAKGLRKEAKEVSR